MRHLHEQVKVRQRAKEKGPKAPHPNRKPAGGDLGVTTPAGQLMSKHVTAVECRDTPFEAGLR
jgi:hypothetical protein